MDSVLELIQETYLTDPFGVPVPQRVSRKVFCQVGPITRTEFAYAGRNGLNPSFVFSVFAGDYRGERTLEYQGTTYGVYRTYLPPDEDYIELYVERKGGTNGQEDTG